MFFFCTYFDSNYLVRALPMIGSLSRYCDAPFRLYALCLDESTEAALSKLQLPGVIPIPLAGLEATDQDLLAVKNGRSRVEYYFTATPCWIRHLLQQFPEIDRLTYLDADLYFYSSVRPIWEEMNDASILIIPHRFPARAAEQESNGRFNVGWLSFRRDEQGMACVRTWREQCLAWCFDRQEKGRYADQKYLDAWPARFANLRILSHKGAGLAPWNVEQYAITRRSGVIAVDEVPLVFYHFQGYRPISPSFVDTGLFFQGRRLPSNTVRWIHFPYLRAVQAAERALRIGCPESRHGTGATRHAQAGKTSACSLAYRWHLFLEGKVVLQWAGHAWYLNAPVLRTILTKYDGIRKA